MLRRKPTALTISPEDLNAFEETHARKIALIQFQKTGADPNGWFTGAPVRTENRAQAMDPNDELKPLPGDKARIVRSREERIIGAVSGR